MKKDYRISAQEAENLMPLSILDAVVFRIFDECPALTDDDAIAAFSKDLNLLSFYIFSAWMVRGDLLIGGVFYIFEKCCKQIILSSVEGFKLLKVEPMANIIIQACQIFPSGLIPDRHTTILEYLEGGEGWAKVENSINRGDFKLDKFSHLKYDCVDFFKENRGHFVKE